jgi:2OG-Fe(II) oxygenase superfamily
MFRLDTLSPVARPFPHVTLDDFIDPATYDALRSSFPDCPANSGPTGYSHFWGDDGYDALLDANSVWRRLFDATQNQAFVDYCLAPFAAVIADEAVVDLSSPRFVSHIENRVEKEQRNLSPTGLSPDQLFVRTDILQGNVGYDRRAHVDHRRRAATMLIYMCDGDEDEMVGGDLVLYGADGETVTVRPRHNRMVLFPCINSSLHAVSRIVAQKAPRNFVQMTISSSVDLWEPIPDLDSPTGIVGMRRAIGRGVRRLMAVG